MIDTHCHLTFPDFQDPKYPGGVAAVMEKAAASGVTGAITISTTTRDCLRALAIAERFDTVWCTAGVHPLYSHEGPHEWENLRRVVASPRCVGWGELGLDNHYEGPHRAVQHAVLEEQLAFIKGVHEGKGLGGTPKPVVIHCREAFDDLIPVLKGSGLDTTRMVLHCFTGSVGDARKVLDVGAWISFTGVVTYRNAPEVREAAKLMPADRIMVETDAPFLSPEPHRGARPCEPWMSSVTAKFIAELRGTEWEAFHAQVNENSRRFFGVG